MAQISGTGWIWVPPENHPNLLIRIGADGDWTDVTDYCSGSFTLGTNDVIGKFAVMIDNSDEALLGAYTGGETVEIFLDYNVNPITKKLKGIIDKVGYSKAGNFKVNISGRPFAQKLLSIKVTKSYADIEASLIVKDLFDNYATEFTYTNVEATSPAVTLTRNWNEKPLWECIVEIAEAVGFLTYIDADDDCNFFEEGSRTNTTEAIVHNTNLASVSNFGDDITGVRNRVIVYGQDMENLPLFAFAEDTSAQASLFLKEEVVTDTNITTMTQAQERANEELAILKSSSSEGGVGSIPGLADLNPGEQLLILDPSSNLTGYYPIVQFTHRFGQTILKTAVEIEKNPTTVAKLIKDRIVGEQKSADISNPYQMRYTYNFVFDDDSQVDTHLDTETTDGFLKLLSGKTVGTMFSTTKSVTDTITKAHIKVDGNTLAGTEYWVSANGGVIWESLSTEEEHTFSVTGTDLAVKVTLNSASTEIDSLAILFR